MDRTSQNNLLSRRAVFKTAVVGGVAVTMSEPIASAEASVANQEEVKTDKECIMEAGLTAAEADCWEKTAEAAGMFFQLPKLHPEDAKEVAVAIHVIQQKLLARPTYRKYLEIAKANHELRKQGE